MGTLTTIPTTMSGRAQNTGPAGPERGPVPRAGFAPLPDYHHAPARPTDIASRGPAVALLDCNEPAWPTYPLVHMAVAKAMASSHRYPAVGELVDQLTDHVQLDRACLAVGAGSAQLYQQLVTAYCGPGDEVILGVPTFEAFPLLAEAAGAVPVAVPLDRDHRHDLERMRAAITSRTRLIVVPNPHNPTGTAFCTDELTAFLDLVPDDVLVVIDEAYLDFVTDPAVPDGVDEFLRRQDRGNVAVLRTFSKAHALAGLRVGYLVAAPSIAEAVRRVTTPYAVNGLAAAAATAALSPTPLVWTQARCLDLTTERQRVRDALIQLGYDVPVSQANFLWLPLQHAEEFGQHCADRYVRVRVLHADTGVGGVRVTIGPRHEMDRFLAVVSTFALP